MVLAREPLRMSADPSLPPDSAVCPPQFLAHYASVLDELYLRAKRAQPAITRELFFAALYASAAHRFGLECVVQAPNENVASYLQGLHIEDLALACALRHGSGAAWEAFIAQYRPLLYAAARAIAGAQGEAYARELADSLYADLYGIDRQGAERSRSLLAYFHGRSKLATWLRTVLTQRHVDALRAGQRTTSIDQETAGPEFLPPRSASLEDSRPRPSDDPDRARLLPRLQHAVHHAVDSLGADDRLLISLYYVEELTLAQIARLRAIHEATASRHLDRIRRQIRVAVEHSLATGGTQHEGTLRKGLSPAEIQLCFTYAVGDWAFDLVSTLSAAQNAATGSAPVQTETDLRKKLLPQRSKLEGASSK